MIYLILVLHFFADFVLQSRSMAEEKSISVRQLALHCMIYAGVMCIVGIWYGLLMGLLHFAVDYVTSRMTRKFYRTSDTWFWWTIGFDQLIHSVILIYFMNVLLL